jgi:methionine biosynthesis protein MetW
MATIEEVTYDKIWNRSLAEKSDFSCDRINEAIRLLDKGNRLLDVGCGEGTFIDLAKGRFDHVFGIDLSLKALKESYSKNFRVIKNNLNNEGISFQNETFDTATCLDVIEHVFDPVYLLSELNRVLKEKGILILTTPNVRFIDHVSEILIQGKFPKTSDDPDVYNGGHVNYFTFLDIRNLLNNSGFKVLSEKGVAHRPYRSLKTIIFRYLLRFYETEVEKEFFYKGIAIKAQKIKVNSN